MDLIYTNENREDIGVLFDYSFDLAFGTDENNFECVLPVKRLQESVEIDNTANAVVGYAIVDYAIVETPFRTASGSGSAFEPKYFYIEGTEYGGIVDSVESRRGSSEVAYSGRTWHGIFNSKILEPDSGEDHLVLSGDANAIIGTLIERMGLSEIFESSTENSGLTLTDYQMERYVPGYDGIRKMLESIGGKVRFKVQNTGNVLVYAVPAVDYSQSEEFDSDLVDFDAKKSTNTVNHLVCLGEGELSERLVIHLYADDKGEISTTQTLTGLLEVAAVYDSSRVESAEELEAKGREKLLELWEQDGIDINFDADDDNYDIGDKVGAIDNITGIKASGLITKKIVTIKNGQTTISYKVGEK